MSLSDDLILIGYLEDALESEHGIKLTLESHDDLRRLRQKLYKVRGSSTQYSSLVLSEHDNELWIVKKEDG